MFDGIIDLSHFNTIDLSLAKSAGIVAVIHKATEGSTFQDPLYASRKALAAELGLLWGAYHFGTSAPVTEQLENFANTAQLGIGDLAALDYESNPGDQMSEAQAEQFVTLFQQRYGYFPLIYGSNLLTAASSTSPLGSCNLWIAEYAAVAQPAIPPLFSAYTLWQFTDGTTPTPLETAGATVDRDRFNGTEQALTTAWPFRTT